MDLQPCRSCASAALLGNVGTTVASASGSPSSGAAAIPVYNSAPSAVAGARRLALLNMSDQVQVSQIYNNRSW